MKLPVTHILAVVTLYTEVMWAMIINKNVQNRSILFQFVSDLTA